jgi:RecB family endonuclease NucS
MNKNKFTDELYDAIVNGVLDPNIITPLQNGKELMFLYFLKLQLLQQKINQDFLGEEIIVIEEDGSFSLHKVQEIEIKINSSNEGVINVMTEDEESNTWELSLEQGDDRVYKNLVITNNSKAMNEKILTQLRKDMNSFSNNKNANSVQKIKTKNHSEKNLENILIKNLYIIEEGMTLIKNQYEVEKGYVDILARDKDNKLCIIELKVVANDEKLIYQSVYYPTQFKEPTRMITICPDYTKKIHTSLKSLGYVEMKTYEFDSENKIIIENFN